MPPGTGSVTTQQLGGLAGMESPAGITQGRMIASLCGPLPKLVSFLPGVSVLCAAPLAPQVVAVGRHTLCWWHGAHTSPALHAATPCPLSSR